MDNSEFHYSNLIDELKHLCDSAEIELLIVAPFIKSKTLDILLESVKESVSLTIITRWRFDEIIMGVSDIYIWETLKARPNSRLKLFNNLHAKYYRADNEVLFGSANVTHAALFIKNGNLEILSRIPVNKSSNSFEKYLLNVSNEVEESLYQSVKEVIDESEKSEITILNDEVNLANNNDIERIWLPKTRNPKNLYEFYKGNFDLLTHEQRVNAARDLEHFNPPLNLVEGDFINFIKISLLQETVVNQINSFLTKSRRFGEMRKLIGEIDKEVDPSRTWQTLMRWLKYYLSNRYEFKTANYSEIVKKIF